MKYCTLFFLCLMTVGLTSTWAFSETADLVQERYEAIDSFEADYVQILTNAATREQEELTGKIFFQKPLMVRWESRTPEEELLIVNQDTVWNYFPQEETVYRYQADEVLTSRTMLRFISGQAELRQDFRIEDQGLEDGFSKIKLIPKNPEPSLVLAYIWADQEGLMHRILLVDFFGNGNELRLENINLDPELEPDLFTFVPPSGAEVIQE
ncbi:outer membrane lipoprotein chaperone LolA [Desulfonatronovibrio hydrogenovorans]|uniref:outer membrane lipoprotein chaperone LolA n=1 Tax=Desulfonatronovibrio hydrogenovorans TaxID=53245 RepID=UPI00048DACD4|nr:outer membrane lipoprotein chaperone LolA [Desulfonatronovibrio hydrogenovorans]